MKKYIEAASCYGPSGSSKQGGKQVEGILELMRAILLRSIRDLHWSEEYKEEAFHFLTSEEEDYVFSFASICEHLGINDQQARRIILNDQQAKRNMRRRVDLDP